MTDALVAWLGKQIDEDEKRESSWYALREEPGLELWCAVCGKTSSGTHHESGRSDVGLDCGHFMSGEEYRARFLVPKPPDPRAMAEIKFKRALLDSLGSPPSDVEGIGWNGGWYNAIESTLCRLAAVYADREGYKPEWKAAA